LPVVLALVLAIGYAGIRLRRRHRRRQLEALRRQRAAEWEAAIRQIRMKRALDVAEPSAGRLRQADVA